MFAELQCEHDACIVYAKTAKCQAIIDSLSETFIGWTILNINETWIFFKPALKQHVDLQQ